MTDKPRYKHISIMMADYEAIEAERQKWVSEHKAPLSMPQFIKMKVLAK